MSFSVLMSIYKAEKPSYLTMSLNSVLNQTLQASEIIIVEDGPLTTDLYAILDEFESKNPIIRRLRLSENHGLKHCRYELVARLDTDDIFKPNRFDVQVEFMEKNHELDVLGTWIDEFFDVKENVVSIRKVPEGSR